MKEDDKGWRRSTKLQVVACATLIIILIYLDNRHNPVLADHILSIAELVITAAIGGRVGMQVTQAIMTKASEEIGQFTYTPDPKDVDDGTVS